MPSKASSILDKIMDLNPIEVQQELVSLQDAYQTELHQVRDKYEDKIKRLKKVLSILGGNVVTSKKVVTPEDILDIICKYGPMKPKEIGGKLGASYSLIGKILKKMEGVEKTKERVWRLKLTVIDVVDAVLGGMNTLKSLSQQTGAPEDQVKEFIKTNHHKFSLSGNVIKLKPRVNP